MRHCDAYAYCHGNCDSHFHSNSYCNSNAYGYSHGYSFSDTYVYAYANTDVDPMHGQMHTDAEAASYTCATSDPIAFVVSDGLH